MLADDSPSPPLPNVIHCKVQPGLCHLFLLILFVSIYFSIPGQDPLNYFKIQLLKNIYPSKTQTLFLVGNEIEVQQIIN